jgi:hypothetical protein
MTRTLHSAREMASPAQADEDATAASQRHTTWVIVITALVARAMVLGFTLVNYPSTWFFTRGLEMGLLANSLLHGLGYSSPFGVPTGPTAFIAPGYPTLVAAVFFLFGVQSGASAIAMMVLHILFNIATVWLMMHVAREVFGFRAAVLAGIFWAIALPPLFLMTIFWDTNISCCALVGMVALALKCRREPSVGLWVGMGALCAVIGLINPALLPSMFAILGWAAWQGWRASGKATNRGWLKGPALGALTMLMVFSPWPIRNAVRFHAFIPLRTTVGFELWMGNRPGATGFLDETIFPTFNKAELAKYLAVGELAYTQGKSDEAKAYIKANPGTFAKMTERRVFRFWSGTGNSVRTMAFAIHAGITTLLGFAGLWYLWRNRRMDVAWLMGLPLLVFPLPYYVTHAEFRYRIVIDPLLTMLAAYAVVQMAKEKKTATPGAS